MALAAVIAAAATTALNTYGQYQGQKADRKSQRQYFDQEVEDSRRVYFSDLEALGTQQIELEQERAEDVSQLRQDSAIAIGHAQNALAGRGISGSSAEDLLNDYESQTLQRESALRRNEIIQSRQIAREREASHSRAIGRIRQAQMGIRQPFDWISPTIGTIGGGISTLSSDAIKQKQLKNSAAGQGSKAAKKD